MRLEASSSWKAYHKRQLSPAGASSGSRGSSPHLPQVCQDLDWRRRLRMEVVGATVSWRVTEAVRSPDHLRPAPLGRLCVQAVSSNLAWYQMATTPSMVEVEHAGSGHHPQKLGRRVITFLTMRSQFWQGVRYFGLENQALGWGAGPWSSTRLVFSTRALQEMSISVPASYQANLN